MNLSDILLHVANFAAPALGVALLLPLLSRLLMGRRPALLPWWGQMMLHFAVGVAVLAVALWWLGHDGKMLTYGLLVLVAATGQWLLVQGWRR